MKDLSLVLDVARNLQSTSQRHVQPPDEGFKSQSQMVLPFSVVKGTRGYIEKVVNQINSSYENGWFDSCSVMIRKLIETLIIETFEAHGISNKIKNSGGDFYFLNDLINLTLSESSWNLGRNTKKAIPKLKAVGDMSAHARRYNAHKRDVDKIIDDIRVVTEELVYLSNLK